MNQYKPFPVDPDGLIEGHTFREWCSAASVFVHVISANCHKVMKRQAREVRRGKHPQPPIDSRLGLFILASVHGWSMLNAEDFMVALPLITHALNHAERAELGIARLPVHFSPEELNRGGPDIRERLIKAASTYLSELN
ncbi:MAG: hypothetical protein PHR35_21715 [Kiritimatiellae bacterium]|nr:hypothetical protein [Kiritimatiellia bacterium]